VIRAGRTAVALHTGVVVQHDAISSSVLHKLDVLRAASTPENPIEATVFAHGIDRPLDGAVAAPSLADLLAHSGFRNADLHIFEFGIAYENFDAVWALPMDVASIGVYHNVTPLDLVDGPEGRAAVERSHVQRENLHRLDLIACDSETNRRDLEELGLPPERLRVLGLPGRTATERHDAPSRAGRGAGPARLVAIGRLVRAKGTLDLLDAVRRLVTSGAPPFTLTLLGARTFSDPAVVDAALQAAADPELRGVVEVLLDAPDDQLDGILAGADLLVQPSYHEGLGLPVIEAYEAGCPVLASDAGHLPDAVGPWGWTFPTGDVDALAASLRERIRAIAAARTGPVDPWLPGPDGPVDEPTWRAGARAWVAEHEPSTWAASFLSLCREALARTGPPPGLEVVVLDGSARARA
jgi:glycosyltransferase involved in cell wall biosynthesis